MGAVDVPKTGLIYYVLEDEETGQVVQRGTTGSAGIAFDQLILAPDKRYCLKVIHAATLDTGMCKFPSGPNGSTVNIPDLRLGPSVSRDDDKDGLPDDGEEIMGTDPKVADSDGDGIVDGVEVRQGGNPLSGLAIRTGIIAAAALPGTAVDVCALNDMALVALRDRGVAVMNIFSGMSPVLISQIDTPGDATAVACRENLVFVADGAAGIAIIDLSNPAEAAIRNQIDVRGTVRTVAAVGTVVYAGLQSGHVVSVETGTLEELQRLALGGVVHDLAPDGDHLFAVSGNQLSSLRVSGGFLEPVGSVALASIAADPLTGRKRLFVGGGIAMVSNQNGYDTVDIRRPDAMRILGRTRTDGPASFKQIVANGSGLGVAAVGAQPRTDRPHDISLFRTGDPANTADFVTTFATPGIANAVSIYNGIAYVADGASGLQVVNFLPFDSKGLPPVIRLSSNTTDGQAEEGQFVRLTAEVSDDVQVRNVEFYLNGRKVVTDGNHPFEQELRLPLRAPGRETVRVRARASDTGGNATWSDELILALVRDGTPPRVVRTAPPAGSISGQINVVSASFSEPLNPVTLVETGFKLVGAGLDGLFGTPDDTEPAGGALSYRETLKAAELRFPMPLPPGSYRAVAAEPLADVAGNSIRTPYGWAFRVFDRVDEDRDGVPDDIERSLGLDPTKADSDGDGILDGDEDGDRDGLVNAVEIILGTNPGNARSVDPNIPDGLLDRDGDALTDGREVLIGTNPASPDSDGDGWNDESEVTGEGDPVEASRVPRLFVTAAPRLNLGLPRITAGGGGFGLVMAQPLIRLGLPASHGDLGRGVTMGLPVVKLVLPTIQEGLAGGVIVAQPPVSIGVPQLHPSEPGGVTLARPPVKLKL